MGVRGDFNRLAVLAQQTRELGSDDVRRRLNEVLGREARSLVDRTFRAGTTPDGEAWAPLRLRDGQPLRDTGRLQRSMTLGDVTARGFRVGTNVAYAPTHQFGATIVPVSARALRFKTRDGRWHLLKKATIPARPFLPLARLPRRWALSMSAQGRKFIDSVIKP